MLGTTTRLSMLLQVLGLYYTREAFFLGLGLTVTEEKSAETRLKKHSKCKMMYGWHAKLEKGTQTRRDDTIVKVNYKALSLHIFTSQLQGFVNLLSLLYHPYLVCILFFIPSLHHFTFECFLSLVIY